MAYIGEEFGSVRAEVNTTGPDLVRIDMEEITFEQAEDLASFLSHEIHKIRKARGEFDRW